MNGKTPIDIREVTQRLSDIREYLTVTDRPLTDALRLALVVGYQLPNQVLQEWATHELNGYEGETVLPAYRVLDVESWGLFSIYGDRKKLLIPEGVLPDDKWRDMASHLYLRKPISYYVDTVQGSDGRADFANYWDTDVVGWAQRNLKFYSHGVLEKAWRQSSRSDYAQVVDVVKNHLLQFALQSEQELRPLLATEIKTLPATTAQQITNIVYATVLGGSPMIQVGGTAGSQTAIQHVKVGDLDSLVSHLEQLGVTADEIEAIQSILEDAEAQTQNPGATSLVDWIGRVAEKIRSGAGAMTTETARVLLEIAVKSYLGQGGN